MMNLWCSGIQILAGDYEARLPEEGAGAGAPGFERDEARPYARPSLPVFSELLPRGGSAGPPRPMC